MRGFFLINFFCLILFFNKNSFASEHEHGKEHEQIYHAFTFEGDVGEARDGKSKSFDLDGWIGGDYNRLWINSEKKNYGKYEEKFELQTLYSRNISQFWDSQIGASHDFSTDFTSNNLTYLTLGIEGLAPQSFETKMQFFLSEKGNYSARVRQEVDIFLTQRLITQPYFESEIFTQDVNELEVKKGISDFEIGVVTRYEISRKFAPYFALRYHSKVFGTANYAKTIGERVDNFIVAGGVRLRF
ncbi:MAG: copper resistance protein B [Rickettsiales bacterium]|nr:copper resistance protein B [Rickettsiales bacterium]